MSRSRVPVRLGTHKGVPVFEEARGLHEPVMGLAVLGTGSDPEVMFEEHGTGETCRYLELHADAILNPDLGPRDVLSMERRKELAERTQAEDVLTRVHAVMSAFGLENAELVNEMLASIRDSLKGEGGSVWIVRISWRLLRRKTMFRVLHAAQVQPDRDLQLLIGEPQPLAEHAVGGDSFVKHLYEPILLLGSPFALGLIGARAVAEASETYLLLVLFGDERGIQVTSDDVAWDHIFETSPIFRDVRLAGHDWVAEVNTPATALPAEELVQWWTASVNALLTEVTDLGRYRMPDGSFDARNAYRELRTLDRIFLDCIRIQLHVRDHVGRVAAAFEFFDLLPGLLDHRVRPRHVWASLGEPSKLRRLLQSAFENAPEHVREHLATRTDEVIDTLLTEVFASVVPGRRATNGVMVSNPPTLMPTDEYLGRLLQSLRDTHHGYELDAPWKRDILDTHTGHIPYAFPELVVLLVLALVADPGQALFHGWVP